MVEEYLNNIRTQFKSYKAVADKTISQLSEQDLYWKYNEESNDIACIIVHMSENMLSRWTNFFESDGEKSWRNRDNEFLAQQLSYAELIEKWEEGWNCLFAALDSMNESNFNTPIIIRNKKVKLIQSITRQIAHYPYHIGQITYIGKMILNDKWDSPSIPRGKSNEYIQKEFKKNLLDK
ncbi:DUF1572 domain-containing protein [Aureispira anguillae]|uniref:DUF1572 domain-containing protein n=1 Tax=Aureispira anguillae TaxID=2864201 RepID=A0A915YE62_9BACT|nr:DUF1572 domain-containing protein [Aureispira anguillae]BDS11373.1 DUF1572 domain-containing protein [Aureispira anguillae]